MYSIPVYSLRFAAHCRSRLKLPGAGAQEAASSSYVTPRFWIRTASHPAHAPRDPRCGTGFVRERS